MGKIYSYGIIDGFHIRKGLGNLFQISPTSNLKIKDIWNFNKCWDINKIRKHFNNNQDVEDIYKIYIPSRTMEDKRV